MTQHKVSFNSAAGKGITDKFSNKHRQSSFNSSAGKGVIDTFGMNTQNKANQIHSKKEI